MEAARRRTATGTARQGVSPASVRPKRHPAADLTPEDLVLQQAPKPREKPRRRPRNKRHGRSR